MNYASGGPELCNFSACRAATKAVSLSYRCFYVATAKSPSTVKKAWGENQGVGDKVMLLSDGNCYITRALGVQQDMSGMGMGVRSKRYSLLAEKGVVKQLNIEESEEEYTVSGPEEILKLLKGISQLD
ncbi:unnamed protein product [Calypogeia fissa]